MTALRPHPIRHNRRRREQKDHRDEIHPSIGPEVIAPRARLPHTEWHPLLNVRFRDFTTHFALTTRPRFFVRTHLVHSNLSQFIPRPAAASRIQPKLPLEQRPY